MPNALGASGSDLLLSHLEVRCAQKVIFHISDVPPDYLQANGGQAGTSACDFDCLQNADLKS